jgi:uncharacterized membrane protein
MRNLVIVIIAVVVIAAGAVAVAPYLRPNNDAFAPETTSTHVSKRLKGIFKGMESGFSD